MTLHIVLLSLVALATLIAGFVVGLLITAKRADKAIAEVLAKQDHNYFHLWIKEWEEEAKAEREN